MEQWLPSLVSLGVGGVIAVLLLYRTLPSMVDAFRAEMQAERASCDARWNMLNNRMDANHIEVMTVLRPVPTQSFTVSPVAGHVDPATIHPQQQPQQ